MGLFSWDQLGDNYSYAQLAQNFQTLDYHDHSAGRGTQIPAGGLAPGAVLSSNIAANQVGAQHLSQTLAQNMGANISGFVGQGYVAIAASQSTTSTTYTTLATPDQISSVTLGPGGLLFVGYIAMWSSTVASAGSAGIFLNGVQTTVPTNTVTAPVVQGAGTSSTANIVRPLISTTGGLFCDTFTSNYTGNSTTGQVLGEFGLGYGFTTIFAAPGSYNVSIQFKVASGTATVSNRQLWVWTRNFN